MDSTTDDLPQVQCSNEDSMSSLEPYLSQEFMELENVHSFYNSYALNTGFGIRKASSSKSQVSGDLIWKKYECDKSGYKIKMNDGKEGIIRRRDTKVGCLAKLEVRRNKQGKWAVTQFIKEHNHALDTPQQTKRHRSHKTAHRTVVARNLMDQLHDSGMGPSKIAKILSAADGDMIISTQNVIDHLRIKRKNNIGREGVVSDSTSVEQAVTPMMKQSLSTLANKVVEQSSKTVETYMEFYMLLKLRLNQLNLTENEQPPTPLSSQLASSSYTTNLTQISVKDLTTVRTKGRPKTLSRSNSGIENSQFMAKKRICGSCGEKGHYSTTCPQKNMSKK